MRRGDMKISPRFAVKDWKKFKLRPNSDQASWRKAVKILHDRINGRFLRCVHKIHRLKYSGFAVLALDCLLAETLQAFKEGKPDTKGQTTKMFLKFLQEADNFKHCFRGNRARDFHEHVRSRIVHHADTDGGWLVQRGPRLPLLRHRRKNA